MKDHRGLVPSAIRGDLEKGTELWLTGNLNRSQDDPKFGFMSRPFAKLGE